MPCRFWIRNNSHRAVVMVEQARDDRAKHPPAKRGPAAAAHDHLPIVGCLDKRRHHTGVPPLGVDVRPLLTGQLLDDSSCRLEDLTRAELLPLCNGVVRGHRRAGQRRSDDVDEFYWCHTHHGLACRPADSGIGRGRPVDTDDYVGPHGRHENCVLRLDAEGSHAAIGSATGSSGRRTFLASLRIRNPCTICSKPIRTSHTPETMSSTTIESNGQATTTPPAIIDMTPVTMYQNRPGNAGKSAATAISETPRKVKPTPTHSDSSKTA